MIFFNLSQITLKTRNSSTIYSAKSAARDASNPANKIMEEQKIC